MMVVVVVGVGWLSGGVDKGVGDTEWRLEWPCVMDHETEVFEDNDFLWLYILALQTNDWLN